MTSNKWGFWTVHLSWKTGLLFGVAQLKPDTTTSTRGETGFREQTPLKSWLSSAVVLSGLADKQAPCMWFYIQKNWFPTEPALKIMPKIKGDCLVHRSGNSRGLSSNHRKTCKRKLYFMKFLPLLLMLNLLLCLDCTGYSHSWEIPIPFI